MFDAEIVTVEGSKRARRIRIGERKWIWIMTWRESIEDWE